MLQAALMANTEVLKEPRGFIRLIEFVSKQLKNIVLQVSFITQMYITVYYATACFVTD